MMMMKEENILLQTQTPSNLQTKRKTKNYRIYHPKLSIIIRDLMCLDVDDVDSRWQGLF